MAELSLTNLQNQVNNKADKSAIPTSLPANGGTSATCSGNAATATKLQTARTINGVAFDGTTNITLPTSADNSHGIQVFTTNGTFTVPSNIDTVYISMVGGGGGGAGGVRYNQGAGNYYYVGAMGGAAESVIDYPIFVTPNENISITVGSGGQPGIGKFLSSNNTAQVGYAGGASIFGSYYTVSGGSGGTNHLQTSNGAISIESKRSITPQAAGWGGVIIVIGTASYITATTPFGKEGLWATSTTAALQGTGYGSGGGGGYGDGIYKDGAMGRPGLVIVKW